MAMVMTTLMRGTLTTSGTTDMDHPRGRGLDPMRIMEHQGTTVTTTLTGSTGGTIPVTTGMTRTTGVAIGDHRRTMTGMTGLFIFYQ